MAAEGGGDVELEGQNRDILESQVKELEEEMIAVRARLHQQRITCIRTEIKEIQDGTHVDLVAKVQALTEHRKKRVAAAAVVKNLMLESTDRLFKAEEELSNIEYTKSRQALYDEIMLRLQGDIDIGERMREREQKALTPAQDKAAGRVRGPRTPRQTQVASPTVMVQPPKRVAIPTGRPIVHMLSTAKIEDDLRDVKNVLRQPSRQNSKTGTTDKSSAPKWRSGARGR